MGQKGTQVHRSEAWWRELANEYDQRPDQSVSMSAFARERGVAASTFQRWHQTLRKQQEIALTAAGQTPTKPPKARQPVSSRIVVTPGTVTIEGSLPTAEYVTQLLSALTGSRKARSRSSEPRKVTIELGDVLSEQPKNEEQS